jgi:universal stress protein A
MTSFHHVLVPVSLSERSAHAVAEAVTIARGAQARLTVLHVVKHFVDAETRQDLLARLHALVGSGDAGVRPHVDVVQGDAVRETLAFAAVYDVDLIVTGARPLNGLERILFESVGDRIVREAECSVLAVGDPGKGAAPAARVSNVLCAVDLTGGSHQTLDVAASVAGAVGARLTVLHVIDPWHWGEVGGLSAVALENTRDELERSATERLSVLLAAYSGTGLDVGARVEFGLVGARIAHTASDLGIDLLVLGAHSKRVLGHTYLGSATRYVRHSARCPLLLARAAAKRVASRDPVSALLSTHN